MPAPAWYVRCDGVPDAAKPDMLTSERRIRCTHARLDRVLRPTWRRHLGRRIAACTVDAIGLPHPIAEMRRRDGRPGASVVELVGPPDSRLRAQVRGRGTSQPR